MHDDRSILDSAPRWLLPSYAHGALLAAWSVGVIWAYIAFADYGFGLLESIDADAMFELDYFLEQRAERLGLPVLGIPALAFSIAVPLGAAIGWLCGVLARGLRIDPQQKSHDAFWWPLLRVRGFWLAAIGVPTIGILVAVEFSASNWLMSTMFAAIAICWTLLPFGVLNRDVLTRTDGAGWWRPRWVGWTVALSFFALLLFDRLVLFLPNSVDAILGVADSVVGLDFIRPKMPSSLAISLALVEMALLGLSFLVAIAAARTVIDRIQLLDLMRNWRSLVAWPLLGPFIALYVRLTVASLWLIAPAFAVAWFLYRDAPQLFDWLEQLGRARPVGLGLAIGWMDAAFTYEWAAIIFPASLYGLLAEGRLYSRLISVPTAAQLTSA